MHSSMASKQKSRKCMIVNGRNCSNEIVAWRQQVRPSVHPSIRCPSDPRTRRDGPFLHLTLSAPNATIGSFALCSQCDYLQLCTLLPMRLLGALLPSPNATFWSFALRSQCDLMELSEERSWRRHVWTPRPSERNCAIKSFDLNSTLYF